MMLSSQSIPMYQNDPESWHRFLYKASIGSIKAIEILDFASMAYMAAVTGDATSPEKIYLEDDYNALLDQRFPVIPPVSTIQELHDIAVDFNWIPYPFRVLESPRNPATHYRGVWGRSAVDVSALMNDAMLLCLEKWSASHMIKCTELDDTDYDARQATAGMLYLSLTWPDT